MARLTAALVPPPTISFASLAFLLARCLDFLFLLSRFLSVLVLSSLPMTLPLSLPENDFKINTK
jgi:hypothetical protein